MLSKQNTIKTKQFSAEGFFSSFGGVTYWDIVNPHTAQSSSVIAEVILYSRICHLKKYKSECVCDITK